jgi:DNA-binding NtrC family response regulator
VDDESAVRFGVREFLELRGFEVDEAETCRAAEERFRSAQPDAVVLDYLLPDGDALALMARLRTVDPSVPLVILTAHGSIELAVRAVKEGAEQFLTKPVELASLAVILERILEGRRERRTVLARRAREARSDVDPFFGTSAAIRGLAEQAARVAASESPVLIQGATGTGKGVLARWLHAHGSRAEEPFVDLNSAGLTREFLESELFGHEKGAFTGAVSSKPGLLEIAHRGTVFLDEIGDVHAEVQPKLLKVLEEKRFRRLGDVRDRRVDIRLVAATHHDLAELVREGRFRSDLYFRISTLPLRVPSLAERTEDIPLLAERLLAALARELGRGKVELSPAAADALARYAWPGNIRELRNVLERAVLLGSGERVEPRDLQFDADLVARDGDGASADLTLLALERRHIERVLRLAGGHVGRAAHRLGVPRSTLYEKIRRLGIRPADPA